MNRLHRAVLALSLIAWGCSSSSDYEITASGTIEATEVTVSSKVSGEMVRLLVDEGAEVRSADTLAVIDSTDYVLQLKQAQANLDATEAQYLLAVRGTRREDLLQAEANFKNAEADLKRAEELAGAGTATQKQLDDARTRFTVAEQTYEKLKRGLRAEEVDIARARRDQAAAQALSLRKKVDDCTVRAPISGTVTKRFVERGELVGTGMALFRVANLREMDLMIFVSATELPRIKLGQPAKVTVDAFNDRSFQGRVVFISPTAEFTPKNIQTKEERTKLVFGVKVRVDNPDGSLKAGIPADVVLNTSETH
jgi:HlyD family secretion protein